MSYDEFIDDKVEDAGSYKESSIGTSLLGGLATVALGPLAGYAIKGYGAAKGFGDVITPYSSSDSSYQ